jgi:hypothetical protein
VVVLVSIIFFLASNVADCTIKMATLLILTTVGEPSLLRARWWKDDEHFLMSELIHSFFVQ